MPLTRPLSYGLKAFFSVELPEIEAKGRRGVAIIGKVEKGVGGTRRVRFNLSENHGNLLAVIVAAPQ
jgi:hypothetical protein